MKKSIVVSIIHTKIFPEEIDCHSVFNVREKDTGYLLTDRLELHFLELGKVNPDKSVEEMSQMEKLAVYLRYAADENYKDSVQKICRNEEDIILAEKLYHKTTKEEREAAWAEFRLYFRLEQNTIKARAIKQGLEEGESIGLKKGIAQEKREIAKAMKDKSMPLAEIAELTGLTAEDIEKL